MNVSKLSTALTITFIVSVAVLFAELLFVLRRRRRFFPPHSSQPPTPSNYYSAKELLYFFRLKSRTRVEPSEPPADGDSPENSVIDVFKVLEGNGPARVLCTIKEDDREEVETESSSILDIPATGKVEGTNAVFELSPCDSPVFFTPMGSPS